VKLTVLLQVVLIVLAAIFATAQTPNLAQRDRPVSVGEVAPDFTLEDQNGKKLALSETRGKSPVVLVFYRGYW